MTLKPEVKDTALVGLIIAVALQLVGWAYWAGMKNEQIKTHDKKIEKLETVTEQLTGLRIGVNLLLQKNGLPLVKEAQR